MAQLCVIQPTTDEIVYSDAGAPVIDSSRYSSIVVSAGGLGVGEFIYIHMVVGNELKALIDDSATVQRLSSTQYMKRLLGGPTYVFSKDLTGAAAGVYLDFCA